MQGWPEKLLTEDDARQSCPLERGSAWNMGSQGSAPSGGCSGELGIGWLGP